MGNIPTETLIAELKELGAQVPKLRPLDQLICASAEVGREFGTAVNRSAFTRQDSQQGGGST